MQVKTEESERCAAAGGLGENAGGTVSQEFDIAMQNNHT